MAFAEARGPYKYYLDPNRAEEILASIAPRAPQSEREWLQTIGDRKLQTYAVKAGDTLWTIAEKKFGNPGLWSKLWQVNPDLGNPHEIEIGQLLAYYRGADRSLASMPGGENNSIPLIKLLPNSKGGVADLDGDAVINVDIKNRSRPTVFLVQPEDKIYGEITGAYAEREALGVHDKVYLDLEDKETRPGQRFAVVHVDRVIRDHGQPGSPTLGTLVKHVGTVEVMEKHERFFKAQLIAVYDSIHRKDLLVSEQKPVQWSASLDPPNHLQANILTGEDLDYTLFVQGQIVLLNKGEQDGMLTGYVFRVYQDKDLRTERAADVEPDYKGEIQVIHVNRYSSVGYVVRSSEPLFIGDKLLPRQAYSNPPPSPHRSTQAFEIN